MQDTRIVLDNVRRKIPSGAKLLVAYLDNGVVKLSQANCDQKDIQDMCNTALASIMREKMNIR